MILDWSKVRVYVRPGPTDMRKQINGLSVIASEDLQLDPLAGNLFVFCNKRRNIMKVLYWDRVGFCLWMKRLEKDKFPWPKDEQGVREISEQQFRMLLDGINFWNAHKALAYKELI